jgi:hypothetical protein
MRTQYILSVDERRQILEELVYLEKLLSGTKPEGVMPPSVMTEVRRGIATIKWRVGTIE